MYSREQSEEETVNKEVQAKLKDKTVFIISNAFDISAKTPQQMRNFFENNRAIVEPIYKMASQKLGREIFSIKKVVARELGGG